MVENLLKNNSRHMDHVVHLWDNGTVGIQLFKLLVMAFNKHL